MAESILYIVSANLVLKLGSLALREVQLLWGVDAELEKLKDTISSMEAVLLDAEEQQFKSHAVKNWVSRLRDAFYDVDDLIDEFSYEILRQQVMARDKRRMKEVRKVFSKLNQITFRFKMSHKIKELGEKLKAIDFDKNQFHFSERMINIRDDELRKRRETSSFIYDDEVIGRDNDKKEIIDLLLDTNVKENIAVIAIVGMGGLGKTTLAQSVYNNEKTTKHFDLKLWVCISEEFDVKVIVEKIIESVIKKKPQIHQMDLLQSELRRHIHGQKYLLIMDDVWNEDHEKWANLKRLLMSGAKGSRILITTRHQQVAETFDPTSSYPLEKLDDKSAWLLFKKMALRDHEESKNELENSNDLVKIGKGIVVKLKGIPLAIRTIGQLLYAKKPKLHYWLSFKDNELFRVMEQSEEAQFMRSILELSYNHLQSNLKQCFLYCALFPKDYDIQKDEVIQQWVAQGFIQSNGTIKPNDIGEDYFMELLSRSFFQEVTRNEMGDIIQCKMHDFMHDLARSIVENEYVYIDVNNMVVNKRTRHISIHRSFNGKLELLKSLFEAKNLRTLIAKSTHSEDCEKALNKIPSKFLQLRTLNLSYFLIDELSTSICKLKHLRYLCICGSKLVFLPNSITELYHLEILILDYCCFLKELPRDVKNWINLRYLHLTQNDAMEFLPDSITELYNLETLILSICTKLKELPKDIERWINLKHLDLGGCVRLTHMPQGLSELTSLQTMPWFSIKKDSGSELSKLNRLNKLKGSLSIEGLKFCTIDDLGKNSISLHQKSGLKNLNLYWYYSEDKLVDIALDSDNEDIALDSDNERVLECLQPHSNIRKICICGYGGVRLCNWLSPNTLIHLVSIEISDCLKLQHLPQFHPFPFLKHLHLKSLSCIEYIDNRDYFSSSKFFPSLEKLIMVDLPNLKGWWKGETLSESSQSSISVPTIISCLSQLEIHCCPQLTSIPWHAALQSLNISEVSSQLLNIVIKMTTSHVSVESSSTRSKLSSLSFRKIEDLEFLPKELFHHFTNLEHLNIIDCKSLQMSSSPIQHPINEDNDDVLWKEFRSLRFLLIDQLPKWEYLPNGLQHVTTLQSIWIRRCPNLITLPQWINDLTSLSSLSIYDCPKLTSLPEGIRHLRSLQSLYIGNSPKLAERYKEGIGEDWPKISHVPDVKISD